MRNTVSFITANFVARETRWQLPEPFPQSWGVGDQATQAYFQPIETYRDRFASLLDDVDAMGFKAIDLWTAHLAPNWAGRQHTATALEELSRRSMRVLSLAGGMGENREHFDQVCGLAVALGRPMLGGVTPVLRAERRYVIDRLERDGLRLAVENHSERHPDEVLEQVGDGAGGRVGIALDTGWFGTQGFDAAEAIRALAPHLMHVHLKDVLEVGEHHTCRFGQGVVPIRRCVEAMHEVGYTGPIGIEHEPHTHDPTDDVVASAQQLSRWMEELKS